MVNDSYVKLTLFQLTLDTEIVDCCIVDVRGGRRQEM